MDIFISYCSQDDNKRKTLVSALERATPAFNPIVVAARSQPGVPLAEKVMAGIRECDVLVPIITRTSISNQWVNQEIGFAHGVGKTVVPLVEAKVIHDLKGFIHSQHDLPFTFMADRVRPQKEAVAFRRAYLQLVEYLQNQRAGTLTSFVLPARVPAGADYTTRVAFKGFVRNGFFDNYVVHLDTGFRMWNWDPGTLPSFDDTDPGMLNGTVDEAAIYTHDTRGWPRGRYKVFVRLYSHLVPGQLGRAVVAEEAHDFEVY